jgi:hypothetical protein
LTKTRRHEDTMEPSRSLLLRYLFPVGMAREPHGDLFLQHAMWVSNVEALRRWLPHYAKVHGVLAALLLGLSALLGGLGASPWAVVPASIVAALEVCSTVVFTAGAIALRLG